MSDLVPARRRLPLSAWIATAAGAAALGALAVGAVSIGALAVGKLAIGRARIKRLDIDDLTVRRLHVLDDGCGLASGADAKPQAFGLLGMSERVHAVGGRLRVYSSAQAGTVVEAILPLDVHPTDSPAPTPI